MRNLYTLLSAMLIAGFFVSTASAQEIFKMEMMRQNTSGPLHSMEVPAPPEGVFENQRIPNKFTGFGSPRDRQTAENELASHPMLQQEYSGNPVSIAHSFDGASDDDNAAILGFRVVPPLRGRQRVATGG